MADKGKKIEVVQILRLQKRKLIPDQYMLVMWNYTCTIRSCNIIFNHYVEFVEAEAVENAVCLNKSELRGCQLKISPKRTNVPGMKQQRERRFPRGSFMPDMCSFPPSPYRRASRYRSLMGYNPY